ncbi:squalene monooxygenase [Malassezia cuniculi]|uniref:Squalene monooxygenase n=1 Tax=Malassezia cuniculi TaxID=948313 RepID=A0AAF0ERR9_9BASI|nr:squalene monooxygenase [Malassezia cuniculi]
MEQPVFDIAIVGAGVVGASLSTALARTGRRVVVFERDMKEPDRIVGELLQPGGVRALQLLGLSEALEGIDAVRTTGYSVFLGKSESVHFDYPTPQELPERYQAGTPYGSSGHYEGRSFHHGRFIMALRKHMLAEPNVTVREAVVTDLLHDANGKVCGVRATENGAALEVRAHVTIVADGCASRFRRKYGGTRTPQVWSHFVGIEIPPDAVLVRYHGHVLLGDQEPVPGTLTAGPVLVYQIGSDATRILIDVPGPNLPSASSGELRDYILNSVVPQLPEKIGSAVVAAVNSGERLRVMPNNFLPPSAQGFAADQQGLVIVGDAMNMRHPLTGGGMTVALWDCIYLTHVLGTGTSSPLPSSMAFNVPVAARDLSKWSAIRGSLLQWHWRRKNLASVINVLAQALYSLFGLPDKRLQVLRKGCFRYFECGGECIKGPVSLLAGLAPDVLLLTYHFFSVAIYSIALLFRGELDGKAKRPSIFAYPGLIIQAIVLLYTACVVLLPVMYTEVCTNSRRSPYALPFAALGALSVCVVAAALIMHS